MRRFLVVVLVLGAFLSACETKNTEEEPANTDPFVSAQNNPDLTATKEQYPTATDTEASQAEPIARVSQAQWTPGPTATPAATNTPEPPPTETPIPPPTSTLDPLAGMTAATVMQIVDGDTIDVQFNGQEYRVRIIGVDTPETKDPSQPVMCYGAEATAFTTQMIELAGYQVYLEKDVSETDRYDRLLRYVWLPHADGNSMLNLELVSQGYAQSSTYPPDVKYQDLFAEAQRVAREEGRGLWRVCGAFGVPLATLTLVPRPAAPQPPPPPAGNCDSSYPGVCIPPYPPDLDCGDVPFRRFEVVPPDPHGFDADSDGIGCESG